MRRDPFQDRLTFINDTRQVVGIGLATQAVSAELPAARDWLLEILQDQRLQPAGRFQDLVQRHVRSTLTRQPRWLNRRRSTMPPFSRWSTG